MKAVAVLGFIIFWLAALVGWIMNIVAIVGSSFDPLTGLVVLRVVGVFVPPLGVALGYFAE